MFVFSTTSTARRSGTPSSWRTAAADTLGPGVRITTVALALAPRALGNPRVIFRGWAKEGPASCAPPRRDQDSPT